MKHAESLVSSHPRFTGGQHPTAVPLPVFLFPRDRAVAHVADDTRNKGVIAFVDMRWLCPAVPDAWQSTWNMGAL